MRISYLSNNTVNSNTFNQNNASKINYSYSAINNFKTAKTDSVSFSSNYAKTLGKFKTLGINEYFSLTAKEVKKINKAISGDDLYDRDNVVKLTAIVKQSLEKKFPNGYTFVSIGRSPEVIAKALEFQGADVKYCPISGICFSPESFTNFINNDESYKNGAKIYKQFMDEIGLSKEKIENSTKTICFVDYTYSGNSLKNFQNLLTAIQIDTTAPNIKFLSLNNDLFLNKDNENNRRIHQLICENFENEHLKEFAEHKLVYIDEIKNTDDIKGIHAIRRHKIMNFALIDKYNKMGLYNRNNLETSKQKSLIDKIKGLFS